MTRVALILLAAGQSKRFVGDKLTCADGGQPMLSAALKLYASEQLTDRFCEKILVTQRSRLPFAKEAERLGFRVVWNDCPEEGISRSIRLGIEGLSDAQTDGILFSVADQPHLTEQTVLRVLDVFLTNPQRITAPIADGKRGNPVLFPKEFLHELSMLKGDVGGSRVIRLHPEQLITVEVPKEDLIDVDYRTEVSI